MKLFEERLGELDPGFGVELMILAAPEVEAWSGTQDVLPEAAQIEAGREQFHRTCAQCHGRNMVNAGTTVYDLRKFPIDQHDRFVTSVLKGKGNMPSFQGALDEATITTLWVYVATRGGKEM